MKWLWAWLIGWLTATVPVASPVPSPPPALKEFGQFRYATMAIDNLSRLQLFSNLDKPENAGDLFRQKNCSFLTNAGFYDTSNQHLGWFYSQGREFNPAVESRLFDGYLFGQNNAPAIDFIRPETAVWGVQSGPVLIHNGRPLNLTIKNDEPRRRVVAAVTGANELIFMIILSPESDYAGPLLAETPRLVMAIDPRITAAVNLDGGSASAFINEAATLKEYSPIGGYFCYTE